MLLRTDRLWLAWSMLPRGLRLESIDRAAVGEPVAIESLRAISVSSEIELRQAVNVEYKV